MAAKQGKGMPKLSATETFTISLVGGSVASVVSKTIVAPIERVKLLLQTQGEMLKQGTLSRPYNGAIDCAKHTLKNEGFISVFWRGNLVDCVRFFPTQVVNFVFKDYIRTLFKQNRDESYMLSFTKNVASGGLAGALSSSVVYSLDYARTRLAADVKSTKNGVSERKYNGVVDVYKKTLATDGIAGLYRGFVVSCVGTIIYRGCYFGLYDTLKPIVLGPDSSLTLSSLLGYGVTITSGFLSYPFDTVNRRMMMTSGEAVKYKGAIDCMSQIIRNEGTLALFKGAGVTLFKGIAGAALLPAYDQFIRFSSGVKVDTSGRG